MKIRVSSACFLHSGEKYLNRNIHLSHQRATFVSGPNVSKRRIPLRRIIFKNHTGKRSIAVKQKKKKILFITSNLFAQIFLFQNLDFAIISALLNSRYDTIPRIIFIIKTDKKGGKKKNSKRFALQSSTRFPPPPPPMNVKLISHF